MMRSSKPTTLLDGALDPLVHARDARLPREAHEPIGSFGEYVEAVLEQDGLQLDLKALLRDSGTAKLYRKYLDLRLPGPWGAVPSVTVVKVDRRG